MTTVRRLLDQAGDLDRLDAEVLLAASLQRDRAWLVAHADEAIDEGPRRRYLDWLNRRRGGEPVAYLTGFREFWSLRLRVTPDTLIPRPETELLVETALTRLDSGPRRVLDLGTGTGAIALALASERPEWEITAVDVSIAALVVARENARRLSLPQVRFEHGSWYEPLHDERFDLIVANPPYVVAGDPHLRSGDAAWEPESALSDGHDGLTAFRAILNGANRFLAGGGTLLVEHGHDQGSAVVDLFTSAGLSQIETLQDLAGLPRAVLGVRS